MISFPLAVCCPREGIIESKGEYVIVSFLPASKIVLQHHRSIPANAINPVLWVLPIENYFCV